MAVRGLPIVPLPKRVPSIRRSRSQTMSLSHCVSPGVVRFAPRPSGRPRLAMLSIETRTRVRNGRLGAATPARWALAPDSDQRQHSKQDQWNNYGATDGKVETSSSQALPCPWDMISAPRSNRRIVSSWGLQSVGADPPSPGSSSEPRD